MTLNARSVRLADAKAAWQQAVNRAYDCGNSGLISKFPFSEHASAVAILRCATALNARLDSLAKAANGH